LLLHSSADCLLVYQQPISLLLKYVTLFADSSLQHDFRNPPPSPAPPDLLKGLLSYMCRSNKSVLLTMSCSSKSPYLLCNSSSVANLFHQEQLH